MAPDPTDTTQYNISSLQNQGTENYYNEVVTMQVVKSAAGYYKKYCINWINLLLPLCACSNQSRDEEQDDDDK